MKKYEITEAGPGDLDGVFRCAEAMHAELAAYDAPFEANPARLREIMEVYIKSKTSVVYVLKAEGQVLGMVAGLIVKFDGRYIPKYGNTTGRLTELYLAPEVRRQSYAMALMEKAEDWFRANGIRFLDSDFVEGNLPSERLHEKLGYTPFRSIVYKEL